jgi:hypothetical protein
MDTNLGKQVYVLVDPATNNGRNIAAAIISRVNGEPFTPTPGETWAPLPGVTRQGVNLRVLLDGDTTPSLSSVLLFQTQLTSDQLATLSPANPNGYNTVAFWTPAS